MIRNPKDFWSGVMFFAVGVLAVLVARDYPLGSALRMGPPISRRCWACC